VWDKESKFESRSVKEREKWESDQKKAYGRDRDRVGGNGEILKNGNERGDKGNGD
jgi:hypothetical protein